MKPTPRMQEIICLRCEEGLTRKECAERMCLREDTVREYTRRLMRRLGQYRSFTQVCTAHGRATMLRDMNGGHA